ncbi:unnamed protein product [Calypogeia fissa]
MPLLLGIEEWLNIYQLAQKGGVQMAIQRILEYAAILDCMEGDDAFELEKAQTLVRTIETVLTKAALDTELAKQWSFSAVPVPPAVVAAPIPAVPDVPAAHVLTSSLSNDPTITSHYSGAASIAVSGPSIALSSSDQSPSSNNVFPPNNPRLSVDLDSRSMSPILISTTPPTPVNSAASSSASSSSTDLRSTIQGNPLLDLAWLTEDELLEMKDTMSMVDCFPILTGDSEPDTPTFEEPYVPVLPPRHLEWESSKVDACLWKIKNINNLAPLSLEISQAWGTVSTEEVLQCRECALNVVTLCDKSPVFISKWPMTIFGPPKYKCKIAAGAKIRGPLDTKNSRIKEHKSKMWNWMRPYFLCSCYYKAACNGQLIWLDHAVWYMLNHLEDFFTASSVQGRLVMLIKFLSGDARRMVLDHITFLYIRDFTIEATQELIAHPHARLLTRYGPSRGIRMVEALVKPGTFSDDLCDILGGSSKKRWNLNDRPLAPPKQRGMYAKHTLVPGVGRGTTPAPLLRSRPEGVTSRLRPGGGRTLPGNESPLQRRNLQF